MKVIEAKKILNIVKSYKFNNDMKSLTNPSLTIEKEIQIMENSLVGKEDEADLNLGLSKSFERLNNKYGYLKDL